MAKYSKKAGDKVGQAIREQKKGTLKTGSGKKVTSRKQAIAIGLSEAREEGAKVPQKKTARKKSATRKKAAPKKKAAAKKRPAAKKKTPAKKKSNPHKKTATRKKTPTKS